jgi:hypothetical protein
MQPPINRDRCDLQTEHLSTRGPTVWTNLHAAAGRSGGLRRRGFAVTGKEN